MKLRRELEDSIAKRVGLTIEEIRAKNPMDIVSAIENKTQRKLTFSSQFPFIGRGNVLRDGVMSSAQINKDIDRILGL